MIRFHSSSVALDGRGVLFRGPSGSGKSDLTLRMIDGGARLVADDYTEVRADAGRLLLAVPAPIAGRLEVRGLGLMRLPYVQDVPLRLIFDLQPWQEIERMPEAGTERIEGVEIAVRKLDPFMASAAAIVRLALRQDPLLTGYEEMDEEGRAGQYE